MPDEVKLLPCPCGDSAFVALLNDARQVWCCRDMCWKGPMRGTREAAIAAWNTRAIEAARPTLVTDEVVERVRELLAIWDAAPFGEISKREHDAHQELMKMGLTLARILLEHGAIAAMPTIVQDGGVVHEKGYGPGDGESHIVGPRHD